MLSKTEHPSILIKFATEVRQFSTEFTQFKKKILYAKEIQANNTFLKWVDRLPKVIKAMNDGETKIIGIKL